jgi:hypothetical protein
VVIDIAAIRARVEALETAPERRPATPNDRVNRFRSATVTLPFNAQRDTRRCAMQCWAHESAAKKIAWNWLLLLHWQPDLDHVAV